jgi:hypothetical protein
MKSSLEETSTGRGISKGANMPPMQCCKCGRFIGPDGQIDVVYDEYHGAYEAGYSYCAKCLKKIGTNAQRTKAKEDGWSKRILHRIGI